MYITREMMRLMADSNMSGKHYRTRQTQGTSRIIQCLGLKNTAKMIKKGILGKFKQGIELNRRINIMVEICPRSDTVGHSLQDAKTKLDKEKLKATFERRKARGDITQKMGPVDELERELENVQLPDENEQIKHERKQSESISSNQAGCGNSHLMKHENEAGDGHYQEMKRLSHGNDFDAVEEGEVEPSDDTDRGYQSPSPGIRQKKAGSPHTSEEKAME
ncbi:hypothetical protein Sango_0504300 [Sesamum angolense]|uniref:Uncharacterized protein n=1 Tax=Sesamum angolense TaxID=2727404 RepID=A0AAE2C4Z6_9LAMI|nr:hypothetical protein Sango_0504300 [Sesamum angolense]